MLLKSSTVLSCLLPARLGFGSHPKPDPPPRPRDHEKHTQDLPPARLVSRPCELVPFGGNALPFHQATDPPDFSRACANIASPPLMHDGGIGESPAPPNRSLGPPSRLKRSSYTTFFAFSSKRKSVHGTPIVHIPHLQQDLLVPPHAVAGRWAPDSGQTQVHLINPTSVPSPLQTDDEEYYYSYYASLSPAITSHSAPPRPNPANIPPAKPLSLRQQDLVGNPGLDSHQPTPVDSRPSHAHIHHPYAYSTPLSSSAYSKTILIAPPLRHATSQPLQHYPQGSYSDSNTAPAHARIPSSQPGHEASKSQPDISRPHLKTSMSTPNLASGAAPVRSRSLIKKKPPKSKGQERWLSAETWWDALLSPSPRFKVKEVPHLHTATARNAHEPQSQPVEDQPSSNLGVVFPSVLAPRPRAASVTSVTSDVRRVHPKLTKSRSAADLLAQPSASATPRTGFEPALETLVDEPIPTSDHVPGGEAEAELPPPDPPLSLAQVIDEGEVFEQQRAQWKQQASNSLGNRHARSFSRARSKSLGARRSYGDHASEGNKTQLNLEFLAARTLLGSQSTMPTVHVTKPSSSSSRSKAYSHSHSQSAYSYSRTSHSHAYSHSHSHSLTTSNSSKSSRNLPPHGHSRNESWSKTALLKASVLCGIGQDESFSASAEENVPSSSGVDVQSTAHIGNCTDAEGAADTAKVSPFRSVPGGEVGIAITSLPPSEGCFDLKVPGHPYVSGPRHREGEQGSRWPSKYTHKSSEYAGPHPSAIDSNLPQLGVASDISLRHRLPPRAAIHPPIAPVAHPYRFASVQPGQVGNKGCEGTVSKVAKCREVTEPDAKHTSYPHVSLSHADFERYGVGEALVYASHQRPEETPEANSVNLGSESSPATELPLHEEQSVCEYAAVQSEELDGCSSVINSPPSLSNSTIQMVVSALDNPDDLDEFQDLFYKPHLSSRDECQEPSATIHQALADVHSPACTSPLAHLVCKLSEVYDQQDFSRTSSDPKCPQGSRSQDHCSNSSGTKFVFMDLARTSSSPLPLESSSQTHLPIQSESESTVHVMAIPEDVNSSYTTSILEGPSDEYENDTFGYPIKRGQFEATTSPSATQSGIRMSTHLSIQEDEEHESHFLSPVTRRQELSSADVVRSSYLTTSDVSQMSALSDFPLPPSAQPGGQPDHMSILQAYFAATPSPESQGHREDAIEIEQGDRHADGGGDMESSGDVDETLRALRMTSRVTSFGSHGSTFGGSDDMDFITQLHQARP